MVSVHSNTSMQDEPGCCLTTYGLRITQPSPALWANMEGVMDLLPTFRVLPQSMD